MAQLARIDDRIVSVNPATGIPLGDVACTAAQEVRAAVDRARVAQLDWRTVPLRERCQRVRGFASELLARADEVVELLVKETGKPQQEALLAEVSLVVDLIHYFTRRAPAILARQRIPLHLLRHRASYLHYAPLGVIGIISSWSFPFAGPVGEAMMALIAGNAVVLKPSELTPLVALKAKELHDACGLPAELLQVVTGRGETGAAVLAAGIQHCIFTGSVPAGRQVAAACGERLISCTLALGGKAPAIVCADADLERTARALVWGAFSGSGQVCGSVERVYAHTAVHDELVARVVEQTRALRQGDPLAGEVDVGAMTWPTQLRMVEELVQQAVAQGARIRAGGRRPRAPGLFFEPTVLTQVHHGMDIMRRECFGPVLPIMAVGSDAEAIALANDSPLGLNAYVFTEDRQRGLRLAEQIEAGTVAVNDVLSTYGCPETPWGGVKTSGIGRVHSDDGLRALCQLRHVNHDRLAIAREPWWYPYSDRHYRLALRTMKLLFGRRRLRLKG
jgi:succinate-semialdehyde dehydrogenase/glutarate-semialdehyde dehydrogenase